MKILTKMHQFLSVSTKEDDKAAVYYDETRMVYKHNNIGVSINYYRRGEDEPFREDQFWFND
jgi:hypothetical protein